MGEKQVFFDCNDEVWEKYYKIWGAIRDTLGIKFDSKPVYEYRYLKAKIRKFDGVKNTNFIIALLA